MSNKSIYLFVLDLDGTVLSNSATGEIHEETEREIKRATALGHKVCIITGRPWRSTKKIYDQLGLDTIVGNFNGAYVHNPKNYNFIPEIKYLNLNEMLYILGDKKLRSEITNLAIEGPGWAKIQKRDENLEKVFGFNEIPNLKAGIDLKKIPLKPTGVILDTKLTTNVAKLKSYLERKYGDLGEFSAWSKGEGQSYVFDITSVGVNKSKVVSMLTRYYNIELDNVVSIGDGFNDLGMFEIATVSVAMKNSDQDLKRKATVVLKKTNKEGGVGYYIKKFLKNPEKEIEKSKKMKSLKSSLALDIEAIGGQ